MYIYPDFILFYELPQPVSVLGIEEVILYHNRVFQNTVMPYSEICFSTYCGIEMKMEYSDYSASYKFADAFIFYQNTLGL